MTNTITWTNANDILENAKKMMAPQMMESLDSMNSHQNVLVSFLGHQLDNMAEEMDTRETRFLAKAASSLWGDLYQVADNEEEDTRCKELFEFLFGFKNEAESAWLTLTFTVAMTRLSLELAVYLASDASEKGNTNALKALKRHKANLASFEDIAAGIMAEVDKA